MPVNISWEKHPVILCNPILIVYHMVPSFEQQNVGLGQIEPFPKQALVFTCSTCLLKTPREKEKLLVTSNFSFSHSVFYPV